MFGQSKLRLLKAHVFTLWLNLLMENVFCDDRKSEIAIWQYPIQPTIFSHPSTKTAYVPHTLEQLAMATEQQAPSVL